jgi:hypothetical protein
MAFVVLAHGESFRIRRASSSFQLELALLFHEGSAAARTTTAVNNPVTLNVDTLELVSTDTPSSVGI